MIPQLKQETFYLMAWILMGVTVIGQLISICISWTVSNIGVKISGIATMLFSLLLVALFLSMWIGQTKTLVKEDPELAKFLESQSLKDKEVSNGKN